MYVWVLTVHGVIRTWTKLRHNFNRPRKSCCEGVSPLTFSLKVTGMLIFVCYPPCWWSDLGVMLKISVKSRKSRSKETALTLLLVRLGGAVKTSVATLRPLRKTRGLALTRKSWSWRCTAKDSLQRITQCYSKYINDTTMAVWTVYATRGIATRLRELTELCEGCVNVRGCVECTELLKANDRVLLTLDGNVCTCF